MTASLERSHIDWWAVECVAIERIRMPLNKAERLEVVRRLVGKLTADQLSDLLGVSARAIERYKAEIRAHGQELVAS